MPTISNKEPPKLQMKKKWRREGPLPLIYRTLSSHRGANIRLGGVDDGGWTKVATSWVRAHMVTRTAHTANGRTHTYIGRACTPNRGAYTPKSKACRVWMGCAQVIRGMAKRGLAWMKGGCALVMEGHAQHRGGTHGWREGLFITLVSMQSPFFSITIN
jgi:hypothetical protein